MIGRVKSRIFDDTSKWTPCLYTNFSSQTRIVLLPHPLFFVVCQQIDICRKHFTHRLPRKYFFLDLRPRKRHVGWKNNFKQFLPWCCYTNFCSFARKSKLRIRVVGHKILICGQTNTNEDRWHNFEIILAQQVFSSYGLNTLGPLCL